MVEAAIAGNPAFAASRIELDRPGPSYTVDTLEALAASDPDLVLILSSEAYAGLPTWHEPRRVLELARLADRAARRLPRRGPGAGRPALPRAWRTASSSSTGRASACRPRSCGRAPRPGGRCGTSSRMRSPPISATMGSTEPPGGMIDRDRTRASGEAAHPRCAEAGGPEGEGRGDRRDAEGRHDGRSPRPAAATAKTAAKAKPQPPRSRRRRPRPPRPTPPRAPTACRAARRRRSPTRSRSRSPAGSSSWPRTRRPPTSSCSSSTR